ncbi:MAG: asparagine synthase (glutamine-hydrolyzing) [Proteobacteria bacterium]|nr:asparagine synthase (glutamine-hydrolyzing) [Pseudomonadota bacterium]
MCAIAGLIGTRPVNVRAVEAMTDLMAHRGPDDSGIWKSPDGRVALGHRRLAIIDTSDGGHQPMIAGPHVLTFNGEIYNYLEIAAELKTLGIRLTTTSDTEVLLAAYRQWGLDCLKRFNGMFAFAIYDGEKQKLFCARDRYGEKPFLFYAGEDRFVFASEFKALFAVEGIPIHADTQRLVQFLYHPTQGLDDDSATLFDGIQQLLPGHYLDLDIETMQWTTGRYWDCHPNADLAKLPEGDVQAWFRELLTDSVRLRMRSDVPLGSCLSGGLDSTAIVCIARRLLGADAAYDAFTGRFPGTDADEGEWAKLAVQSSHATRHEVVPTQESFRKELPAFVWHNELPVGSASQYAQWCVFRLAGERGTTVLLDGQGADELLGGYEQMFQPYLDSLSAAGEKDLIAQEGPMIQARYPLALNNAVQRTGQALPQGIRHSLAGLTGKGSDFSFGLKSRYAQSIRRSDRAVETPHGFHPLTRKLYVESFHTHLPVLLRYGDRNSMAHSREVRLPFCDHRLAEFALSLPAPYLMGGAETKRLLRRSLDGILPEKIRLRWNKQGFLPPHADWFRDGLLDDTRATIESTDFQTSEIWRAGWWKDVLKRFQGGETHLATMLWRPYYEDAWRRHFLRRVEQQPKHPIFATVG